MANIFQMFGEIMVDNAKANTGIDETTNKGKHLGTTLSDVTDKIGKGFAAAGAAVGAMAAAVGGAVVGAAKALTDMTIGASEYADEILTMSTVTGMSTEALQAYKYAAELVDVPLETLTKSMAKQIKSMAGAADGNDKLAAAYEQLGIKVTNSDGSLRDSDDVYWETIDALGKMTNETERDALGMELLGKSAQQLNPLIEQGSAGMAKLTDEAKKMGAVMSDESLNALGKFDDTVQRLKSGADAAKNAMGTILLPQLQSLAGDGVDLLGKFTTGLNAAGGDFSKISDVIGETIGGIADSILENLPKIMEVATDIVMALVNSIVNNLPLIFSTAQTVVMSLLSGIIPMLPTIIKAGMDMIISLISGIGQALPELIPAIVSALMMMVQTIIDNLPLLLDAGLQLMLGLIDGILNALPQIIAALPKIITGIIDFVIGAIPQIIEAGIQLLVSLVEALPEIITAIVAAIPKIITGLIDAVLGNIDKIIEAGVTLLIALVENTPKIIVEIVKAIPLIIDGIVKALMNSIGRIIEVGGNLIKGLWQGISDAGEWLWDKISGFFTSLTDKIKDFFGIKSPSKVFAGIGKNMGEGIGVGFEDAMKGVGEDMKNAIPTDLNMEYGITGRYGTTGAALLNASSAKVAASGSASAIQPVIININDAKVMRPSDADWLGELIVKNLKQKGVAIA